MQQWVVVVAAALVLPVVIFSVGQAAEVLHCLEACADSHHCHSQQVLEKGASHESHFCAHLVKLGELQQSSGSQTIDSADPWLPLETSSVPSPPSIRPSLRAPPKT